MTPPGPLGRESLSISVIHWVLKGKRFSEFLKYLITSNVRLNNLSQLERHPLRQYLAAGVPCVQGTDGGAIYGTDSIDEELALEKTLNSRDT